MRLNREMVTDRALEINHQSLAGSPGFYGAASPARTEAFRQQPRPATLWPMRPMAFCLPALLLVAGCSTFQRDWEQLANKAAPLGIEGRWEGSWKSDVSGHADRLRCIISRRDAQAYLARFH